MAKATKPAAKPAPAPEAKKVDQGILTSLIVAHITAHGTVPSKAQLGPLVEMAGSIPDLADGTTDEDEEE